ncbi:MAG: hypothetical protein ACOC4M_13215 [Promethearchaeia archaeon]
MTSKSEKIEEKYICPRCESANTRIYKYKFQCLQCGRVFSKSDYQKTQNKGEIFSREQKRMFKRLIRSKDFEPSSSELVEKNFATNVDWTNVFYQWGTVRGMKAKKYFIGDNPVGIRIQKPKLPKKPHKKIEINIPLYLDIGDAQKTREACLKGVVKHYFRRLGFSVYEEPRLQLSYTPDLFIKRDDVMALIELKAYHKNCICGDAEISQAVKYYETLMQLADKKYGKGTHPEDFSPKVLLITTGTLIDSENSFFPTDPADPVEFVEQFYHKQINAEKSFDTLDEWNANNIYKDAPEKFEKNLARGFRKVWIRSSRKTDFTDEPISKELMEELLKDDSFDILLMGADLFQEMLDAPLTHLEDHYFRMIREMSLELLMLESDLLQYPLQEKGLIRDHGSGKAESSNHKYQARMAKRVKPSEIDIEYFI